MAAILCQSISSLCSTLCESCGKICTLPCTLCSSVCKPISQGIRKVCTSHFCTYLTVTLGLNIPPLIFSGQGIAYAGGCKGSQWLLLNMMLCISNIIAAFYLVTQTSSWDETMKVLCYDPWIAGYILVVIFFFVWLCTGLSWKGQNILNAGDDCPDNIVDLVTNSIYCGFSFFSIGCTSLIISSLISMCCGRGHNSRVAIISEEYHYKAPTPEYNPTYNAQAV